MKRVFIFGILLFAVSSACTSVKPYQRAYLNDSRMKAGSLKSETFEQSVFNYREGAVLSGTSKGKGGCGCN